MTSGALKSDWFTGLIITLIFFVFYSFTSVIESMERSAYDIGVKSSSRTASNKVAIIAIDDQSIDNIGRWPWSRDIHAQMHDILAEGGAKVVGQTIFFPEPQLDPGLLIIREFKQALVKSALYDVPQLVDELAVTVEDSRKLVKNKREAKGRAAVQKIAEALKQSPLRYQVAKELETYHDSLNSAEQMLNTDSKLSQSIHSADNVILLMPALLGQPY